MSYHRIFRQDRILLSDRLLIMIVFISRDSLEQTEETLFKENSRDKQFFWLSKSDLEDT